MHSTNKHNKTIAIALIALAASAGIQTGQAQAEEQENYVWITRTNGITEKRVMTGISYITFGDYEKARVAQIVVPEHASIGSINVRGCVNLTNLIFRPPAYSTSSKLFIDPTPSLRTIAMRPEMMERTYFKITGGQAGHNDISIPAWLLTIEWTTNWQTGDPPKMEIRTITTNNGNEVEVIWRASTLQIADALNGKWRDHSGSSPYRVPLASAKDMQFFRIKPEEEEEPEENQGIPPQPEK